MDGPGGNSSTVSLTNPLKGNNLLPMHNVAETVTGIRGVQGDLVLALKKAQPLTVHELADQFHVTPNALRRHLKALEENGLICYKREIRGVGGPVFAYSLTEGGEALFPRAYSPLLEDALEALLAERGEEAVVDLVMRGSRSAAAEVKEAGRGRPLAERARLLAELRTRQGFMAVSETREDGAVAIREYNCAIREVATRFPAVCEAELKLFAGILGAEVERRAHALAGCNGCEYLVREAVPAGAAGGCNDHMSDEEEKE
jgi:DeoR family transcriptional regulator, suf operon transcriptional repressor